MKILKLIWYIIKVPIAFGVGALFFIVSLVARIFGKWACKAVFLTYLQFYFWLFRIKVNFEFSDESTRRANNTVFVLLNQFSFLDSMITPMLPVPRTLGILNIEFGVYPVLGWFYVLVNFVIVRQWHNQATRVLNNTNKFLNSGGNIIISIEGKRSKTGVLSPYKKGPVVMAIKSQSNIAPMIIEGAFELLPYGSLHAKSGTVTLKVLEPISTKGYGYEDRNKIIAQLRETAHLNGLK